MNILIVNQSPYERAYLIRLISAFQIENHVYRQAAHGYEALDIIKFNHIDLVISDIALPYMNGSELIDCLKNSKETCTIPIIIVSNDFQLLLENKSILMKVNDFLIKPFKPMLLEESIKRVVDHKQSHSYIRQSRQQSQLQYG